MTGLAGDDRLEGGGIKQEGKRTHRHGQQCGDFWGDESIRGLKGNGKNTMKIKLKKRNIREKPNCEEL